MHPQVISGWPYLHSYGLMLVIGFYSAYFLARWRAKKDGLDPAVMIDILLIAAGLGIVGARAFYVVQYSENIKGFADIFAIWNGGLVFYGGLITAMVGLIIYIKRKKLSLWKLADAVAPAIMLGLALGRIGCFLNGCCWGAVCEPGFPLAVQFPRATFTKPFVSTRAAVEADGEWRMAVSGSVAERQVRSREDLIKYVKLHPEAWRTMSVQWWRPIPGDDGTVVREIIKDGGAFSQHLVEHPKKVGSQDTETVGPDDKLSLPVHPTQLYSSLSGLTICGILLLWSRWRRRPGEVLAMMACLYAVARFWVEGIRHDTNPVLGNLTISQTISIGMLVVGLAGVIFCRFSRSKG